MCDALSCMCAYADAVLTPLRFVLQFIVDGEERPDPHAPLSTANADSNVIDVGLTPVSPHRHTGDYSTLSDSTRSDNDHTDHNFSSASMDDSSSTSSFSPSRSSGSKGAGGTHYYMSQHKTIGRATRRRAESSGSPQSPSNFHPAVSSPLTQTSPALQPRQKHQRSHAERPSRRSVRDDERYTDAASTSGKDRGSSSAPDNGDDDEYGQIETVFVENKKAPPLLPPHLRYTPLNSATRSGYDPSILPVPLHVTVNHVYFASQGNVTMVGISQRYRDKFSTIVMYRPSDASG